LSEIDPRATSREIYARATLIAGSAEGMLVHTQKRGRDTPGISSVFKTAKSIALHIARGPNSATDSSDQQGTLLQR
jgi:hypothetical protein